MVQLAHNLVEETETQHRKITGKFHYNAKEQVGKTHGWLGGGILNVGSYAARMGRKGYVHVC